MRHVKDFLFELNDLLLFLADMFKTLFISLLIVSPLMLPVLVLLLWG